jgi:DNA-binding transcriptional LysR family regulator
LPSRRQEKARVSEPTSAVIRRLGELKVRDIVTAVAVARLRSLTAVARELRTTPSQVSKAVARIEAQVERPLFARSSRGVVVTDEGSRLLPHLMAVVSELQAAHRGGLDRESLIPIAAPSYLLLLLAVAVARAEPRLRIQLMELASSSIRARASEGVFDVALFFGRGAMPPGWLVKPVGEVRKGLFAPPELAKRLGPGPVSEDDLRDIPFITPISTPSDPLLMVDDECPIPITERKAGHQTATLINALELASLSPQLVFGPVIAARNHVLRGALVEIPVKGWKVSEPVYIGCREDRVLARDLASITAAVRAQL